MRGNLFGTIASAAVRGATRTAIRRTMGVPSYRGGMGYGGAYGFPGYRRRPRSILVMLILAVIGGYGAHKTAPNLRSVPTAALSGRAQQVIDGDTFHLMGYSIRLWGIDAPERDTADGPGATQALQLLLKGRAITCKPAYWSYERLVAKCTTQGRDISTVMVRTGWARDLPNKSGGAFAELEQQARAQRVGMWK